MAIDFVQIGSTVDTFFWALIEHNAKLYAGTYGLDTGGPRAYNYPSWTFLKAFAAGESITEFAKLDGKLYASTEQAGYIYIMNNADPTDWGYAHQDSYNCALSIKLFNGYLYCYIYNTPNGLSRCVRSNDGDTWTLSAAFTAYFLADSVVFDGKLYLVGNRSADHKIWAWRTTNGLDWENAPGLCDVEVDGQWICPTVFDGKMYIGMGERPDGKSKIFSYNGTTRTEEFSVTAGQPHASINFDGKVYFTIGPEWKTAGTTYLYRSANGSDWGSPIKTWTGKSDARALGEFDGKLYLGVKNIVYRMDEDVAPAAPSNFAAHYVTPDKSYCTWEDNSDDETGFRIEYQLDRYAWSFPPSKEIGGILSLTNVPTVSEWEYCGFIFIVPFNSEPLPGDLVPAGAVFIPYTGLVDPEPWGDETGIVGYFLEDDTPYSTWEAVQIAKDAYDAMKAQTDKPIGSIFYMPPNEEWREKLVNLCNYLDFALLQVYPYRVGWSEEQIDAHIQEAIDLVNDISSPMIILPQGGKLGGDFVDPGEAGIRHQYETYYNAGLCCCWYPWDLGAGIASIRQTYQALMNEFYHGWTFFENKGVNATQSSQKQFSIGDKVKWRVRAYNAVGSSAWAVSDDVYIGSQGSLQVWTSQADFEAGTLSNVLVPEGLNRLELKRLALTGTGTWIFDGGAGRKFNWLTFKHTNPNRNIYYRDDFRDNSLEAWTIVAGTWQGVNQYMRGTGNLGWQTNRVRVGPTTWEGLDILFKGYYTSAATPGHNFFLRCDTQGFNVYSYGFELVNNANVSVFRVAVGDVVEYIDKGVAATPSDAWYWFRVQIYTSGSDVVQRIKWWLPGNEEPETWNVSHTWTGIWRSAGCFSFGRHTTAGENRYDDILISRQEGIPSPANCSVSFKFWASNDETNWGSQYTDIAKVPNSRFLKIEATLARTNLLSAMPTLEDMTLGYRLATQAIFI